MPARTSLERVGRSDFFAIMAPGFYIFTTVTVVATGLLEGIDTQSVWHRLVSKWHPTTQLWSLGFGVIFFSYLLGNMLRALPVDLADSWTRSLRSKWRRTVGKDDLASEGFPYRALLTMVNSLLKYSRKI